MTPAPSFSCDQCGRRIGKTSAHFILNDNRVVCVRHHTEHNDAGNIRHSFCTRAAAAPAVARGCQLSELLRQLSMPSSAAAAPAGG